MHVLINPPAIVLLVFGPTQWSYLISEAWF